MLAQYIAAAAAARPMGCLCMGRAARGGRVAGIFRPSSVLFAPQPSPIAGPASSTSSSDAAAGSSAGVARKSVATPGNATTVVGGPYRRVGNIFIVTCDDHPFKFSWEVNRMLRDLRLEFRGQTAIHPDIPEVRKRLWRVRHIVRVDRLDLDEAKELVGIPAHMTFSELSAQIPASFGRGGAVASPHMRSKHRFLRLRRMRLRDVLHRDELEKKILEERRRALTKAAAPASG